MKKVLFLGDSNTWGYDPRGYFQRYDLTYIDYLNDLVPGWIFFEDAINGRLLRDVKEDTFDLDLIDLFCVMLGSNDLIHYYDVDQILSFMHELIDSKGILMQPNMVMGVPCLDCNPLDMSFDGVHLSEKGHKELGIKIAEYMKRL